MKALKKNLLWGWFFIPLLFIFLFWSFKIPLVSTDLGRHLQNGKFLWESPQVLYTNFYSYTFPDFYFLNHHWLAGVIFYGVYKIASFVGLNLLFLFLITVTFYIFWQISLTISSPAHVLPFTLLSILLLSQRQELRPEFFSYLLLGLEFKILWEVKHKRYPPRSLFLLIPLQILWANVHIFFWLGIVLQTIFLLDFLLNNKKAFLKGVSVLSLSSIAGAFSPFGISNLAYPLFLWKNYGYPIIENQTLFFVQKRTGSLAGNLFLLEALLVLFILAGGFWTRKLSLKKDFVIITLSLAFVIGGLLVYRNIFLFSLFFPVLTSYLLKKSNIKISGETVSVFSLLLILISLLFLWPWEWQKREIGWGLERAAKEFLEFTKNYPLPGKIFNNYDIGSFLIFALFPEKRVFVDNRPEAYPVSFFKEYIALQENLSLFKKKSELYDIQTVVFYWHDLTPWGQKFLTTIVYDPDWLPVFANSKIVVLVKNNQRNQKLFEGKILKRELFRVTPLR